MKLELGGGTVPTAGYTNLDPVHGEGDFRRRVQEGIPLPDCSVEAARCSHLMEHIPAGQERIAVFNDVWRVLVPRGTFEVVVPLFSSANPVGALADPTHVSLWIRESFAYFTGARRADADYGLRLWEMADWTTREWEWGTEGHALLRKPA